MAIAACSGYSIEGNGGMSIKLNGAEMRSKVHRATDGFPENRDVNAPIQIIEENTLRMSRMDLYLTERSS
jgi:hypothetical protein